MPAGATLPAILFGCVAKISFAPVYVPIHQFRMLPLLYDCSPAAQSAIRATRSCRTSGKRIATASAACGRTGAALSS